MSDVKISFRSLTPFSTAECNTIISLVIFLLTVSSYMANCLYPMALAFLTFWGFQSNSGLIIRASHFCQFHSVSSLNLKAAGITLPHIWPQWHLLIVEESQAGISMEWIEDPKMNPHTYAHVIFDNKAKTIQWKKVSIFKKLCWFNLQSTCRRMQIDPLSTFTNFTSK